MKIALFPDTCAIAGKPIMKAFIKSLQGEDYDICLNTDRPNADVVVMWSVLLNMYGRKPIYQHYKSKTKLLIIEVGGLVRNQSWRIGIGGINAEANFANDNVDDARIKKFNLYPKPWRGGDHIIICTQNINSAAWHGGNMIEWVDKQLQWIRSQSNRKVFIRIHPRHKINAQPLTKKYKDVHISTPKPTGNVDEVDFKKLLQDAHAVVNYNSNPAIESVLEGVPVFVDNSSLCRSVGNTIGGDIENPVTPDRTEWCKRISYCEWFVDEIEQGLPWRRLKEII